MDSIVPAKSDGKVALSDADFETAMRALRVHKSWALHELIPVVQRDVTAVAQALADQRAKYEALADELDEASGLLWKSYKQGSGAERGDPHTEGKSDAFEYASQRIRGVARA